MDVDLTFRTLVGEPFVEIIRAVQVDGDDVVLAGTRGAEKLEQFCGSTAKRLIRKCPASVWIVKAEHLVPPKVVLAATDFSDMGLKAVKEGLRIAQRSGAEFHLLHIIDSEDMPEDLISEVPEGSTLRQEINDEATRRLGEFVASLAVDPTQIQSHLSSETPWQEIRRISKHQTADLIVIRTVGRSGIQGLLLGNTADIVRDTCDCSILTIKPDDFVSRLSRSPIDHKWLCDLIWMKAFANRQGPRTKEGRLLLCKTSFFCGLAVNL